jgi:microcystin-dependent protein
MAINFPDNPSVNDTHTVGDKTYVWNGEYWRVLVNSGTINSIIKDDDNDTKIQTEKTADDDTIRFDTAGTERLQITPSGHIIPSANEQYDLGSETNRFRDIYLSGASIDLGGVQITSDGETLSIPEATFSGGTVSGNLTVTGDLTVSGTTTTINTTELLVEDNIVTLNNGTTGAPVEDAGIEVDRGDQPTVAIKWSEADDTWHYTNDGTLYDPIGTPTGAIIQYGGTAEPQGWLLCDGRQVSRTTYARLFASLGGAASYPYGLGNGTTTFNLPNLKGKVPIGRDSADTSFNDLGETGGAKTVTLTAAQSGIPAHGHTFTGSSGTTNSNNRGHSHANTLSSNTVASSSHTHTGPSHQHSQAFPIHPSGMPGTNGPQPYTPWNTAVYGFGDYITYPNRGYFPITGEGSSVAGYAYLTSSSGTGNTGTPSATTTVSISNASESQNHTHTFTPSGTVSNNAAAAASEAHSNLQPYIVVNYLIKV